MRARALQSSEQRPEQRAQSLSRPRHGVLRWTSSSWSPCSQDRPLRQEGDGEAPKPRPPSGAATAGAAAPPLPPSEQFDIILRGGRVIDPETNTDAVPYGGGTYASRATAIGGEATYQAALDLRREILEIAGQLLQADPQNLDIVDGNVVDFGSETSRISLAEIGRIGHFQLGELPNDYQPVLSHTRRYRLQDLPYIFTNGIHGAYVEVDADTGWIKHLNHWVVEDCGRIINPLLADEQVRGGAVQGRGGALYEHCIYDAQGQLQNGTMADYVTPMAKEMPDIEVAHVQTPTSESELGAKGAGESGTGAAPGVIMNAVNDAIRPLTEGKVTEQPITPEVVLKALKKL